MGESHRTHNNNKYHNLGLVKVVTRMVFYCPVGVAMHVNTRIAQSQLLYYRLKI